ncbi:MAG TPA: HEPN domain-containing protein [Chitinophagaceae bacterium]|nr:HEPN domain-containing protein [Chitinophagaceae bacterium]
MNKRKAAAIRLKIEKAKKIMEETDVLIQNHFYTTLISRLYYSCFHATKALLLTKDLIPKTHKGVFIMLYEHFVKENLFDNNYASFFNMLMQERIKGDYDDDLITNYDEVGGFIEPAKQYVQYVEKLINEADIS